MKTMRTASAEAVHLTITAAKLFYPWMWHTKAGTWTERGQQAVSLRASLTSQIQEALDRGMTLCAIKDRFIQAKKQKEKVSALYPLLTQQPCAILGTEDASLLVDTTTYVHQAFFTRRGLRVVSFTMDDALEYCAYPGWSVRQLQSALRTFMREWGLDLVLYAMDALRDAGDSFVPDSPWALTCFKDEAQERLALRQRALAHVVAQTKLLEALQPNARTTTPRPAAADA